MSLTRLLFGIGSVVTVLVIPVVADAQVCASSADCPQGTTCQTSAVAPTPVPTCPAGATCAKPLAAAIVEMTCQPAPCQVDVDCGQGMACHSETVSSCSGGTAVAVACPANTPCDALPPPTPSPTTCTQTTISACVFRWQLSCNVDSDCGVDFVCAPSVTGVCSGGSGTAPPATRTGSAAAAGGAIGSGTSSGSGAPSTGATPPAKADAGVTTTDPPSTCTTTTSFPGYCQPRVTSCNVDADCPANWTCTSAPTLVGGSGVGTPISSDAGEVPPPAPMIAAKVCEPAFSYPLRGTGVADSKGSSQAPDGGNSMGGSTTPPTTNGAAGGPSSAASGCAVGTGDLGCGSAFAFGGLGILGLLFARRRRNG